MVTTLREAPLSTVWGTSGSEWRGSASLSSRMIDGVGLTWECMSAREDLIRVPVAGSVHFSRGQR
jgi:hypothetical protein